MPRYKLRMLLVMGSLIGAGAGVMLIAFIASVVNDQGEMIRDAYCLDWASAAIVQHLDDNANRLPKSWGEFEAAFVKVTSKDKSFSFDEVKSRVNVNFAVDPKEPDPRFLWLKSGREVSWGSPPPNERIRQRLSNKHP